MTITKPFHLIQTITGKQFFGQLLGRFLALCLFLKVLLSPPASTSPPAISPSVKVAARGTQVLLGPRRIPHLVFLFTSLDPPRWIPLGSTSLVFLSDQFKIPGLAVEDFCSMGPFASATFSAIIRRGKVEFAGIIFRWDHPGPVLSSLRKPYCSPLFLVPLFLVFIFGDRACRGPGLVVLGAWHVFISVRLVQKFVFFNNCLLCLCQSTELTCRHCYFADDAIMCCPPPVSSGQYSK